jgi:hypothetical protein
LPVPLGNPIPVEEFTEQITVPPDAEVARPGLAVGNLFALHVPKSGQALARGPHLIAAMPGIDVERDAPADVRRRFPPDQITGSRIAELGAVRMARAFMDIKDFQAGSVWIDVGKVDGVAVPQARCDRRKEAVDPVTAIIAPVGRSSPRRDSRL